MQNFSNICYKCIYRRPISGDAHSKCVHPASGYNNDPLSELLSILGKRTSPPIPYNNLSIKGSSHGIKNGWFNFPYNFDPVWLENCDGFTPKENSADGQ